VATRDENPEKYAWWINELNSLGIKQEKMNEDLRDIQALENLTDDIKQLFIHSYKDELH
jgi:nucleoside-specific outer membrane channel protein Tsx